MSQKISNGSWQSILWDVFYNLHVTEADVKGMDK